MAVAPPFTKTIMKNSELCLPVSALSQPDEGGAAVAPGVGDEVEVSVTGRVTRSEGGDIYMMPVAVNGQPLPQGGEGGDPSLEEEGEALSAMSHGSEGMGLLVALLVCVFAFSAGAADVEWAKRRSCPAGAVSNSVVVINNASGRTNGVQAFSAEINNFSGSTLYLLIFDSNTNQLAGAVPHMAAVAVPTGTTSGKDWGSAGMPFDYGVNVCLSTTPFSLTNASSGGTATVVWSPRDK